MTRTRQLFEGGKEKIHFSPANAYPAGSYQGLLTNLGRDHTVLASEHRPIYTDFDPDLKMDWAIFADDLAGSLRSAGLEDLVGVGHSLGAISTLRAALKHPGLFKAVVLIEPVLMDPAIIRLIREAAAQGGPEIIPFANVALRRRNSWQSRQDAFNHYRPKKVFSRFQDESLWDYVNAGTKETSDGTMELAFPPLWEAHIYTAPPEDLWEIARRVPLPALALKGEHTDTISDDGWQRWQKMRPGMEFVEIRDAGHLLPMEKPGETAGYIRSFIKELAP